MPGPAARRARRCGFWSWSDTPATTTDEPGGRPATTLPATASARRASSVRRAAVAPVTSPASTTVTAQRPKPPGGVPEAAYASTRPAESVAASAPPTPTAAVQEPAWCTASPSRPTGPNPVLRRRSSPISGTVAPWPRGVTVTGWWQYGPAAERTPAETVTQPSAGQVRRPTARTDSSPIAPPCASRHRCGVTDGLTSLHCRPGTPISTACPAGAGRGVVDAAWAGTVSVKAVETRAAATRASTAAVRLSKRAGKACAPGVCRDGWRRRSCPVNESRYDRAG